MKLHKISSLHRFDPTKLITNPEIYTRKNETIMEDGHEEEVKMFAEDGLFSPSIFGQLNTENEYSCACGKYNGKVFEGVVCDNCIEQVSIVGCDRDFDKPNYRGSLSHGI